MRAVLRGAPGWASTGSRSELAILWDRAVWQRVAPVHIRVVLPQRAGVRPARVIQWMPLRLRSSGTVVTVANLHADPHVCWHRSPWYAEQGRLYFHAVRQWAREQRAAHPKRVILLGGDLNCWVPAKLRTWFGTDRGGGGWGADHLLSSRWGNRPAVVRRWSVPNHSDHDLELRRLRWR